MANIIGKDGSFKVGATIVGSLDAWSIARTIGTADVTAFGSSWESHDPTIKSWTATISGTLNSTDAQQLAIRDQLEDGALANISCNFMLGSTTAPVFAGTGIIESDAIGSGVKDKVTWSCNIKGDGALTWDPS